MKKYVIILPIKIFYIGVVMAKKEIKKTYRIGFVKNTESIIKGFPFIIDRIEFLGNDKIELKTYLTTKVLNIINIDNGIIKVETENSFYIIYGIALNKI